MVAHQCPHCELRFVDMAEVVAHLIDDHDIPPEALERHLSGLPSNIRPRRRPPDVTHAAS